MEKCKFVTTVETLSRNKFSDLVFEVKAGTCTPKTDQHFTKACKEHDIHMFKRAINDLRPGQNSKLLDANYKLEDCINALFATGVFRFEGKNTLDGAMETYKNVDIYVVRNVFKAYIESIEEILTEISYDSKTTKFGYMLDDWNRFKLKYCPAKRYPENKYLRKLDWKVFTYKIVDKLAVKCASWYIYTCGWKMTDAIEKIKRLKGPKFDLLTRHYLSDYLISKEVPFVLGMYLRKYRERVRLNVDRIIHEIKCAIAERYTGPNKLKSIKLEQIDPEIKKDVMNMYRGELEGIATSLICLKFEIDHGEEATTARQCGWRLSMISAILDLDTFIRILLWALTV